MTYVDIRGTDTICAAITPLARSAVATIRVSGPHALEVKNKVFAPKRGTQRDFVATFGDILDQSLPEPVVFDEGLCVFFPNNKSYTGEPCFELSLHGNPILVHQLLSSLRAAGCRTAQPGEFSMRAVLNKKISLSQAESVADLIDAKSQIAAQAAMKNLKGGLEQALIPVRNLVVSLLCEIEARLDFPDEGIEPAYRHQLTEQLLLAQQHLEDLIARSLELHKSTKGTRILLCGAPNAGKSTLLNTLVGQERCLVHDQPGTTRDVVEVLWELDKLPITLVDVAGIREDAALDVVEILGIERAKKELDCADLILWVQDIRSSDTDQSLSLLLESKAAKILPVYSKSDLATTFDGSRLCISAQTGQGITALKTAIRNAISVDALDSDEVFLTRSRQIDLVKEACGALNEAARLFHESALDECVAQDLRVAGRALDDLLGLSLNEDILDQIFSRFCIGK